MDQNRVFLKKRRGIKQVVDHRGETRLVSLCEPAWGDAWPRLDKLFKFYFVVSRPVI